MNVNVIASVGADKSVTCDIRVGHHAAAVTFADGEITLTVPSGSGDITFTVPEALAGGPAAG